MTFNIKRKSLMLAASFLIAGASAAFAAGSITGSYHDLSASGGGPVRAASGQQDNEICVWCHTPHGANTGAFSAPLWNKANDTQHYAMYGTTLPGTVSASSPDPVSLSCLSCHDGVSAINSVILQPSDDSTDFVYHNPSAYSSTEVTLGATPAGVANTMSGVSDVTTNLQGTHPVSIQYTAGVAGLKATGTPLSGWLGESSSATIGDLLYNGQITCASCHDPHNDTNNFFLRVNNEDGSTLCFACHGL